MTDFSLVAVDHEPDFDDLSLVPVEHDPFGVDDALRQAPMQLASLPRRQAWPENTKDASDV